jgi:autotransporter-associated beta strand protein
VYRIDCPGVISYRAADENAPSKGSVFWSGVMQMKKRNWAALAAASAIVVSACAQVSQAAIVTWDSSGANPSTPTDGAGSWNTSAANWSNGASDAGWNNGDAPVFGANNGAADVVTIDDAAGGVSAAGLTFNAAGSGNYTIAAAGADTLTLTSAIITANGATSPTISAPIAGTTGITVAGTGTLTLSGANTYTGANLVSSGTLTLASGGTLGAAANTLTLGAASPGSLTDMTAVNANINQSATVGGLTVNVNSGTANVVKIAAGQTMLVNGAVSIGQSSATLATNTVINTGTPAGSGGEMDVNGSVTIGLPNTNATSTKNSTTADFSGLSAFKMTATAGTLNIGDLANTKGVFTLASGVNSTNIIDVGTINDGVSGSSNANTGNQLNLGSGSNAIEATAIMIGTGKSSGVIQFISGAPTSASVTISGLNGTGTSDITIGSQTSGSGTTSGSGMSLAGHTANVNAGTVIVGQSNGNTAAGATAAITFDTGTFNVSSLNLGIVKGSGSQTTGASGTFTLGTNSSSTGVLNVSSTFVLASDTNAASGATAAVAAGNLIIKGGTANISTNITSTGTKGTTTGTITLSAGTLDMMGHSIGGAVANSGNDPIALTATGGAIKNLLELNGGGALTKSGATTLVLAGANSYTGPTNITAGTLDVDGTHTGGALYTVSSLAMLGGDGSTTAPVMVSSGGILSPGDSIHSLGVGSTTLDGSLNIELNDADPNVVDLLNVAGNLDISGTSAVSFSVTGTPTHSAYVFANYSSLTGTAFATVSNLPAGYSIDYNYQGANDIALVAAPVPEPSSIGLVLAGATGLVARRRRRA